MKLLLHMCCGPCACYPIKQLKLKGIESVGYFFNPNIHPYKEWEARLHTAIKLANIENIQLFIHKSYDIREFLKKALVSEGERNGRCNMCYAWRLEEVARFAADNKFEAFTSTLFYSIYQQHDLLKLKAERLARKYKINFYYEDFRIGWQEGIDISIERGLYRQKYCGCIFSEEERYNKKLRNVQLQAGITKNKIIQHDVLTNL